MNLTASERRVVLAMRAVTATAPAPVKDVKYVCLGDGTKDCYKAGHQFSKVGTFGDKARGTKGHSDLNPTHVMKQVV